MTEGSERLQSIMREQAGAQGPSEEAERLRRLAATMKDMTPSERTWVEEASEQELQEFVTALRVGCEGEGEAG